MQVGAPEHDAYLRELMLETRTAIEVRARTPQENAWREECAEVALERSASPEETRELLRQLIDRGPALPELSPEERVEILRDAVHSIWIRKGEPQSDAEQLVFDRAVDALFEFAAREVQERKAPAWIRAAHVQRRMLLMPGIRSFLGLRPIR